MMTHLAGLLYQRARRRGGMDKPAVMDAVAVRRAMSIAVAAGAYGPLETETLPRARLLWFTSQPGGRLNEQTKATKKKIDEENDLPLSIGGSIGLCVA